MFSAGRPALTLPCSSAILAPSTLATGHRLSVTKRRIEPRAGPRVARAECSGPRAGAALDSFDDGWADVDLIEPFDALHPARALSVDLDYLAADHIDADEVHA